MILRSGYYCVLGLVFLVTFVLPVKPVQGQTTGPVQLRERDFNDALAGATSVVVEDLKGFSRGFQANPMTLANGTYTAPAPVVALFTGGITLTDGRSVLAVRSLSDFPPNTTLWGAAVGFGDNNEFQIIVTGGSGTSTFITRGRSLNGFIGFRDDLGITSVSVQNFGNRGSGQRGSSTGNYGFFSITTATFDPSSPISSSFANEQVRAAFVAPPGAGRAGGEIRIRSDNVGVQLDIKTKDLPAGGYHLVVNGVLIAHFPSDGKKADISFSTDPIPSQIQLRFDPTNSTYEISRAGVVFLVATVGGDPVGGGLLPLGGGM